MEKLVVNIKNLFIIFYINLKKIIKGRITKRNAYRKNRYYNSKVHKEIDEALVLLNLYYNNTSTYNSNDNSNYEEGNEFNQEMDNNSMYDWNDFNNSFDDTFDDSFDSNSGFDSNFNN